MAKNQMDLKSIEDKWKKYWAKEKVYQFDANSKKKVFSVDTPPPYISGKMHIGHAFSYSQQDFIIRFMRMKGLNVFYPFGTDDNGLPTERFIEKTKKVRSLDMGRSDFIKLCLKTLKEITPDCVKDFADLGISADYSIYYSTIDEHSQKVSQKSFIDLYGKGQVYQKNFPTLWCPSCGTSIAQAELEDKEKETELVYLKAKMDDGSFIIYATTRPELHPGCIGISLNEKGDYVKAKSGKETWVISKDAFEKMKDEFSLKVVEKFKGKKLLGKKVKILYAEQDVVVSHDASAKTDYGTGIVYYCSYGGVDCVQWLGRHPEAKPVKVMDESGKYIVGPGKGLKSNQAREKITLLLEEENYVIKKEKMKHAVNTHDKCGTAIEFVETPQWFTKILDKKNKWIEMGKKINWYPAFMYKRYENWVNGLEWDWSISRNRHFGVPIPVWYCKACDETILPKENELPVDPLKTKKTCVKCKKTAEPEKMVLDTWATSSLSPQIVASLPQVKNKVQIPFSLRPQGHDIIRTWAFYTIVKSYLHENKIPWKDIIVSGNVSLKGEKMSKSKGNVVDPINVMEQFGSDALRFWAAGSKLGSDLDYQEKELVTAKKFITKLSNATKFVFMNLEGYKGQKPKKFEVIDLVFLSKLNSLIKSVTLNFERYEYSRARQEVENFFWHDFCDNYLEIVKKRVYNEKGDRKVSAQYVLHESLLTILKMIAPIMPFITEEIYQTYFKKTAKDKSIHVSNWPVVVKVGKVDEAVFDSLVGVLSKIRHEKTKAQKSMKAEIILTIDKKEKLKLKKVLNDLMDVSSAKKVDEGKFSVEFV